MKVRRVGSDGVVITFFILGWFSPWDLPRTFTTVAVSEAGNVRDCFSWVDSNLDGGGKEATE